MAGPFDDHNMAQRQSNANNSGTGRIRLLATAFAALLFASVVLGQTPTESATPKAHRAHKPRTAQVAPAPPQAPVDTTPPQPEMPKWPVNEAPGQPTVTWDSQGLRIHASNSSLSQILNTVSTQTGAKVEGVSGDERVFGDYGPGPARDVLSQLLHGSDYNFLLLGDQGQGTPRQVILTARHSRSEPGNANRTGFTPQQPQEQQDDDNADQPEQQPEEPPQAVQQPPQQPAPPPDQMTPQQRMQMMQQQRLQQMQQMQQQYQQQQQQQPQQPQ
jgi:hypothetical protein